VISWANLALPSLLRWNHAGAEEQYEPGWHCHRKHPRKVKIVGDPVRGRILLVDVKETNGQTGNGRLEAVM
jgi:hypothetical protein